MDQATVQKLHKAIEARVKAEIAWHDAVLGPQLPEHRALLTRVHRARRAVERILECEFDPAIYNGVNLATRRAFVVKEPSGEGFGPVSE